MSGVFLQRTSQLIYNAREVDHHRPSANCLITTLTSGKAGRIPLQLSLIKIM